MGELRFGVDIKETRKYMRKNKFTALANIGCVLISFIVLLPFMWMLATSLRLPVDSFRLPPSFFPTVFHVDNYVQVFRKVPLLKFIGNSFFVSVTATLLQCMITCMAAYAFARLQFKGKNIIFLLLLSGLMIPVQSTVIPIFMLYKQIGLMDSRLGVILPLLINPLGIFIMKQFMESIPGSYDEAAKLDGAGHFAILFRVILPMTKPAIVTVAVLSFVSSWNDFYRPLIFITSSEKMTLPLGMTALSGLMRNTSISIILAGIIISAIPLILIYSLGQKYFVEGISLSGLKG